VEEWKEPKKESRRRFVIEPEARPLLLAMYDEAKDKRGPVLCMAPEADLSARFVEYLKVAGVDRAELYQSDVRTLPDFVSRSPGDRDHVASDPWRRPTEDPARRWTQVAQRDADLHSHRGGPRWAGRHPIPTPSTGTSRRQRGGRGEPMSTIRTRKSECPAHGRHGRPARRGPRGHTWGHKLPSA
jgi:hypothetical protein